jgi:hypothetical protein
MRAFLLSLAVLAVSCSTAVNPVAIRSGDVCDRCRRLIAEPRLAGEIVQPNGMAARFRTAACMATYLKDRPQTAGTIYVTDYSTGKLISTKTATFVPMVIDDLTRERDYAAFESATEAAAFARQRSAQPVDWSFVVASVADRVVGN